MPPFAQLLPISPTALQHLGEVEQGLDWTMQAYAMDPDDPYTVYGVACTHASVGRAEEAIDFLSRALEAGFAHRAWLENDSDFDPIRDHPRFRVLLEGLD